MHPPETEMEVKEKLNDADSDNSVDPVAKFTESFAASPPDANAPKPTAFPLTKEQEFGPWIYTDAEGNPFERAVRMKNKSFPRKHWENGAWVNGGAKDPLYLYNLAKLEFTSTKRVLVVEGEKTLHVAEIMLKYLGWDWHVVSWGYGAGNWHRSDWSPLYGRDVIIGPDFDKAKEDGARPGPDAALGIADHLLKHNTTVAILKPIDTFPNKWDLADLLPVGATYEKVFQNVVTGDALRAMITKLREREAQAELDSWPDIVPLSREIPPEPFPLECLENPMHRKLVEALAAESECPVDLVVTQSFPTIAAVIQAKSKYDVTHLERPCIYAVGLAFSGDRKSPIERALSKPLHDIYRERYRDYNAIVADGADESEIRRQRIAKLKKDAAKAEKAEKRSSITAQIKELQGEEPDIEPPQPLIATEATGAGVKRAMMRPGSDETLFLSDSEARIVEILFGGAFDSGGEADSDIIQKAYSGDSCNGLRGRDDSVQGILHAPTLSIGLVIQNRMMEKFFQHDSSVYKGSIARFLWCWPESLSGSRTFDTPRCPPEYLVWWDGLLRDLHELKSPVDEHGEQGLFELGAAPGAVTAWRDFIREIEPDRNPTTGAFALDGEAMLTWAGKLEGHVIRIAIALHAILYASGYVERPISERTMQNAIHITKYYIAHARRVFLGYGIDPVTQDAKRVLVWLERAAIDTPGEPVSRRDLNRKGFNNWDTDPRRQDAAIKRLEQYGYIKIETLKIAGKCKPRTVYKLNPQLKSGVVK